MAKRSIREVWVGIPGCPGYEVSDQGRVRSLDRWVRQRHGSGTMYWRLLRGKPLSPGASGGHYTVNIGSKPQSSGLIHQLVLLAFKGPPPKGLEVCHNNGNGFDNRLSNLRYDTHRGNHLDSIVHGVTRRGERHPFSKLTEADVRAIRRSGLSMSDLAKKYGVTKGNISHILAGNSWGWLK